MTHLCQECGRRFERQNTRGRPPIYCSPECQRAAKRRYHNDPMWKKRPAPTVACCLDAYTASGGKKTECPQHAQNREIYAKWRGMTQRQKRAGGVNEATGSQMMKGHPTESDLAVRDMLTAGHEYAVEEGLATNRYGPDEGESTYFEEVSIAVAKVNRKAMEHPWWNEGWEDEFRLWVKSPEAHQPAKVKKFSDRDARNLGMAA